jgi:hypothetical protein
MKYVVASKPPASFHISQQPRTRWIQKPNSLLEPSTGASPLIPLHFYVSYLSAYVCAPSRTHIPSQGIQLTAFTASLLLYLFGLLFIHSFILVFITCILLLSIDFYYLKNIAGRRLVGLRWWNEVNPQTGESHWVFESSDPETKIINATDSRFFWIALYSQPLLWVALAVVAVVRFEFIWLTLVGMLRPLFEVVRCKVAQEKHWGDFVVVCQNMTDKIQ